MLKKSIKLACKRCQNEWNYRGSNPFYATCSMCKTSVRIKDNLTQSDLPVGQPSNEIESNSHPAQKITTTSARVGHTFRIGA
jgi:hypothetical protein